MNTKLWYSASFIHMRDGCEARNEPTNYFGINSTTALPEQNRAEKRLKNTVPTKVRLVRFAWLSFSPIPICEWRGKNVRKKGK